MRQAGILFAECMHLPELLSIMSPAQGLLSVADGSHSLMTFWPVYRLVGTVLPSQQRRY